jgi:ferredoxin-NADP reductase
MSLMKWRNAQLLQVKSLTPNTSAFIFQLAEEDLNFMFKPGQFLTLDLPIHEQRNKRWRSYSIANTPNQNGHLELIISNVEGGPASAYFFQKIQIGDWVPYRGPSGVFVLPEKIEGPLFFIATGSGVVPYLSMLRTLQQTNHHWEHPIYLVFGTRHAVNIIGKEELEALAQAQPLFKYLCICSQDVNHLGQKGYVHQLYEPLVDAASNATYYLCGWKNMVDDVYERLLAKGVKKDFIKRELYS